jgi:hypothetical protein
MDGPSRSGMSWHLGLRLPSDGLAVPSPDPVRIALRYASLVVTVRAYVADHARPCVCPLCLALAEHDHPGERCPVRLGNLAGEQCLEAQGHSSSHRFPEQGA